MSASPIKLERILVGHPDQAVNESLSNALRGLGNGSTPVYSAASLPETLEKASRLDPHVVFIDLGASPELAREVADSIRRPGRFIVGIYNPLLMSGRESDVLRAAARAGVDDFVALPIADADVHDLLLTFSAHQAGSTAGREGATVSFFSARGGAGTTTLALYTAMALTDNAAPDNVVFCDTDLQFGTAAHVLGISPEQDLAHLVQELDQGAPLQTYLTPEPSTGLPVLPRPAELDRAARITPEDLSRVLITLRRRYAHVVIDIPATLNLMTLSVLDLSECIFVVADPCYPSLLETGRLLTLLSSQGFSSDRVQLVINHPAPFPGAVPASVIEEELKCAVRCTVPHDPKVRAAAHGGEVLPSGRAKVPFSKSILNLVSVVGQLTVPTGR